MQRVGPISLVMGVPFQRWLRAMNVSDFNVFVSVNAITPGRRSRRRDAIGAVRHIFVDADDDGGGVLTRLKHRSDVPSPNYILHSSPNHVHIFWRVAGFDRHSAESLQKQLARELGTDPAATPVTQNTRLPGFINHKRAQPHLVTVEYPDINTRYAPADFPAIKGAPSSTPTAGISSHGCTVLSTERVRRAKRYLASVPPAVAGQHGDVHTFRVCCRLVRGFALNEDQALEVLSEWNARCLPPWTADEMLDKIRSAQRYGREPVGGLL